MRTYNPDFDPIPPAEVLYGHPAFHTRLINAVASFNLPVATEAMQEYFDNLFCDLKGASYMDLRGTVTEYTHPDDPYRPMHTRLMTDAEIEVKAVMMLAHELNMPSIYNDLAPKTNDRIMKTMKESDERNNARKRLIGRGLMQPIVHIFA